MAIVARERDRDRGATTTGKRDLELEPGARGGKEPDPNSPFAKLLALKEQLQGNKDELSACSIIPTWERCRKSRF